MNTLTIERESKTKKGKTRRFSAVYLSSIRADILWDGGRTDTGRVERPVFLAVAGGDTALRPFLANLRMGRRADIKTEDNRRYDESLAIQLLRSTRYDEVAQRHGDTTIVQLLHPDIWPVEPGMVDPDHVSFLSIAPAWWHREQLDDLLADRELAGRVLAHAERTGLRLAPNQGTSRNSKPDLTDDELLDLLPDAARFIQYLDRRTRRPIPNDPAFYLQIFIYALARGQASLSKAHEYYWKSPLSWAYHKWASGFDEFETAAAGFRPGVVMHLTTEAADEFLAGQVKIYTEAMN